MEGYQALIIGAGITGCTIAHELAKAGLKVLVIEKKAVIGGNCADKADKNGIMIQAYGPHIFHTRRKEIFEYLSQFGTFNDYKHKVLSKHKGRYFPIPINITTCNMFFGKKMGPPEMKTFLETKRIEIPEILNSRDVVVSRIGEELYEAFIANYTKKQWDVFPDELDRSVLERLPIRFDDDDYYFSGQDQGLPISGFSAMMERMLDSPNITILLNTEYKRYILDNAIGDIPVVCTAPIDEFFDYRLGKLKYRSLRFEIETLDIEKFQSHAVINFADFDVPYTRITEFKHFYGTIGPKTVIMKEFPTWEGEPMYPVPMKETRKLYELYKELSAGNPRIMFAGRLGTYQYLDIDTACMQAIQLADELKRLIAQH